jgi:hypothetical protein
MFWSIITMKLKEVAFPFGGCPALHSHQHLGAIGRGITEG